MPNLFFFINLTNVFVWNDSKQIQLGKSIIKNVIKTLTQREICWEFPGDLLVRILDFDCHQPGSIPGQGTEIPQAIFVVVQLPSSL